ncbi:MAG: ferritin family protein [Halanaerobiaceae bacterium]
MDKTKFNAVEVLEMAKEIELKGKDFYQFHAENHSEPELSELFLKLAKEEQKHYDTFNELSKKAREDARDEVNYIYDYQVSAYLKNLVEFTVFPPDNELEEGIDDLEEILTIGIMAEKDSILFYREMMEYNQGKTAEILERLVAEEKQHLMKLTNYKTELI